MGTGEGDKEKWSCSSLSLPFLFALIAHSLTSQMFMSNLSCLWQLWILYFRKYQFKAWQRLLKDKRESLSYLSTLSQIHARQRNTIHFFPPILSVINISLFYLRIERSLLDTYHPYLGALSEGKAPSCYLFIGVPLGLWGQEVQQIVIGVQHCLHSLLISPCLCISCLLHSMPVDYLVFTSDIPSQNTSYHEDHCF